jgi:HAD superfamily hydrolase (TIGR01549 family)
MKTEFILFDFDGTLADTKQVWLSSIKQALDKNRLFFKPEEIEKSLGPKLETTFKNLDIIDSQNKIRNEVHEQVIKKLNKVKPCPYIKETLKYFKKQRKIRVFLLTNSPRKIIIALLKKIRILNFFDEVYCSEDFDTKEKFILDLAKKYNLKTKEIAYIGDKIHDEKIGKKAKCQYYVLSECSFDKLLLKKKKQKFILKDIRQLKKIK